MDSWLPGAEGGAAVTATTPYGWLSLFKGRCGHQWVGATCGSFGCPVCGDHEGDHHLLAMEDIAVQVEDWGTTWEDLSKLSHRLFLAQGGVELPGAQP
jgi:hypothetical protein